MSYRLDEILNEIQGENAHHAYGIEISDPRIGKEFLDEALKGRILFSLFREKFLLPDVQLLRPFFYEKRSGEETAFLIVAFQEIGMEAQNALLKDVEELRNRRLIFLFPHRDFLFPTLQSRLIIFPVTLAEEEERRGARLFPDSEHFLALPLAEKFTRIKEFLAQERKQDRDERSTISEIAAFLNRCERALSRRKGESRRIRELLRDILEAKRELRQRAQNHS